MVDMVKLKNLLLLTIALVLIVASTTACSQIGAIDTTDSRGTGRRFVETREIYHIGTSRYSIVYDNVTKVVYLKGWSSASHGMSPLYNADGVPMLLDEYNQTK